MQPNYKIMDDDTSKDRNDTATAITAGLALAAPKYIHPDDGVSYTVVPHGGTIMNLEQFKLAPDRTRRDVTCDDAASFINYIKTFRQAGTRLAAKATETGLEMEVVFDFDQPDKPAWGSHRMTYTIESNKLDIRKPEGAAMVEIVTNLQAKVKVEFHSGVKLANGNVALGYVTTTETTAGTKGAFEVPERFTLGLQPFEGGPHYPLEALLRYDIAEGRLSFRYELDNPHRLIRLAVEAICALVTSETGFFILKGKL